VLVAGGEITGPAQKFVPVSAELYHNRSPWVLDSDKGVCYHYYSK